LPQGWCVCKLENVIDYEQPQPYIVESTAYSDDFSTPVLTAGKSFIIGYTSETEGIVNDLPVIIFDDFTTDSKYVDFPFKVKSSAIKILHVKPGVNPHFIAMLMSITRLTSDTHKRYWISECSKITIILPPAEEQRRIVDRVNELCAQLDLISQFTGN
jgi:type I restriction enzyme S subunit